jgi:hypothetical protein
MILPSCSGGFECGLEHARADPRQERHTAAAGRGVRPRRVVPGRRHTRPPPSPFAQHTSDRQRAAPSRSERPITLNYMAFGCNPRLTRREVRPTGGAELRGPMRRRLIRETQLVRQITSAMTEPSTAKTCCHWTAAVDCSTDGLPERR